MPIPRCNHRSNVLIWHYDTPDPCSSAGLDAALTVGAHRLCLLGHLRWREGFRQLSINHSLNWTRQSTCKSSNHKAIHNNRSSTIIVLFQITFWALQYFIDLKSISFYANLHYKIFSSGITLDIMLKTEWVIATRKLSSK